MAIDVSGLEFFIPVFSFLFVFIVVYALLFRYKVLGDSKFVNLLISFIAAVIFISFSSLRLYVETIIPWFVVLVVVVFFILLLGMFSSKDWVPKSWLAWIFVGVLVVIFLISAIYVFNPVFHPDLIIAPGGGESFWVQVTDFFGSSRVAGSILLIIVAVIVSWVLTKK